MTPATEMPITATDPTAVELGALRVMVCPMCHTPEPTVNQAAIDAGRNWTCRRCSQNWDGSRLLTAAAYAVWATEFDRRR